MISIVLPVYNGEKYLSQSIDSILNQTYKDFELIIVNDCSTDCSPQIMSDYQKRDSRIKVINNETNQKLPRSLNIGFANCSGDYFTWTSDDNIMLPSALEKLLGALQATSSDLVFSRVEIINTKGEKIGATEVKQDLDELYYNNIVLASFLYKREVHEMLNGYDVSKFLVEDYDFWLRAYQRFKFTHLPEAVYQTRFHGENLGTTHYEDVKLGKIQLLKENLKLQLDKQIVDCIYREISTCYFEISNHYYNKLNEKKNKKMIFTCRLKDMVKRMIKKHNKI